MPTITIRIEVPEGSTVMTDMSHDHELGPGVGMVSGKDTPGRVEEYFRTYLSDNGRELYSATAAIELEIGTAYTFDDIAERIGRSHASTLSIHRTTGRSARKWRADTGTEAPIRMESIEYEWDQSKRGMRTSYRLPDGVAEQIAAF